MRRIMIYVFALAAIVSCAEKSAPEQAVDGKTICFSIDDDLAMKNPIFTLDELQNVYVRGTRNSTVLTNYNNSRLSYRNTTGLWEPATSSTWAYDTAADDGYSYTFSAYGYNGTAQTATLTTTGDNFGRELVLVEPAAYVHQAGGFGYDYVLSQMFNAKSFKVINGGRESIHGPVVELHMEHALALIDVRLRIQKDIHQVTLQGVSVNNFFRGGSLSCTSQAEFNNNSGATNKWSVSNYSNSGGVYSRGSLVEGDGNTSNLAVLNPGGEELEEPLMLFTAVPQKPTDATISIALLIQELDGGPTHQLIASWPLNAYYDWSYGYRNIYTISIDTSNRLDATISDWPTVNNVSGVVLPRI